MQHDLREFGKILKKIISLMIFLCKKKPSRVAAARVLIWSDDYLNAPCCRRSATTGVAKTLQAVGRIPQSDGETLQAIAEKTSRTIRSARSDGSTS
jgi:hypothetical protein